MLAQLLSAVTAETLNDACHSNCYFYGQRLETKSNNTHNFCFLVTLEGSEHKILRLKQQNATNVL